jgi:serine phosphatase RsbU (regulator of sigma subunit)
MIPVIRSFSFRIFLPWVIAVILCAEAKSIDTLSIEKINSGFNLNDNWKFFPGDDPLFSQIEFNDSAWYELTQNVSNPVLDSIYILDPSILWYRFSFYADSSLHGQFSALEYLVKDACEIYYDGKLVKRVGTLKTTVQKGISGFRAESIPVPILLSKGRHLLAIRYSRFHSEDNNANLKLTVLSNESGFRLSLSSLERSMEELSDYSQIFILSLFSGIFLTLSIFHFILFIFYRTNRTNLYYSLFTFFLFIIIFGIYKIVSGADLNITMRIGILEVVSVLLIPLLFIALLYQIFYKRMLYYFWALSIMLATGLITMFFTRYKSEGGLVVGVYVLLTVIEILRVYFSAWKKKKEGASIFLFGILLPPAGVTLLALLAFVLSKIGEADSASILYNNLAVFFGYSLLLSVSVSMTIYLARDFSRIHEKLNQQLKEIKYLFHKTVSQEEEKKKILENQKAELELKVIERTSELAQKNRDILDNLKYARRIQSAILPETTLIYKTLTDAFIFYKPKDIVSGDFYTFSQKNGKVIIAAADCTGHGVTGAFLSMIGISLLNQLINEQGFTKPAEILNNLNSGIVHALRQKESEITDGMDIAVCCLDLEAMNLEYAGSNRPLYRISDGEFTEIKPDKLAIGGFRLNKDAHFTNHTFKLKSGDCLYLFTDGFADQFGGKEGRKMLSKRMRDLIMTLKDLPMREQQSQFNAFFEEWKGLHEQVDDVLIIGIRIR